MKLEKDDELIGEESYDGVDWYNFRGYIPLMKIHEYWSHCSVYEHSDGYGIKGHIPIQGPDWSGCRDSSDKAILEMLKAAEKLHGNKSWPWEE